ncbi:MAG TPA: ABC transporter permease [Candidatus Saccharimonadales bacterium]|nr:ABC transporter permease [Candidatus Saccharimonadales bacterium]
MNRTLNTLQLGIERGWMEFKLVLKDPQSIVWIVIMFGIFLTVLWFQRGTEINGISLALLTLPSLLGMQIASSGFNDVASVLAADREDGTLFRAKATPRGMSAYFIARIVVILLTSIVYLTIILIPSLLIVPGLSETISVGDFFTLAWLLMLGLLATAPFGAIIGSIVKSSGAGWGLTLLPLIVLTAISGIFYPITALAGWVQAIAQVFPVYWLGLGVRSAFNPEVAAAFELTGSWRTAETVLVLLAWAIVGLLIVPKVLRKMARHTSGSEMQAARERMIQRGY